MKKLLFIGIAVLTIVSCQQQKIGFVDNVELINNYQEKIDTEAKIKTKIEGFQKRYTLFHEIEWITKGEGVMMSKGETINVKAGDILYREPGVRNEEILEAHMTDSDPTVLVSPSMSYGVDLKGDLAKFQIIVKAPFLPTKDVRIERMMKNDFDWYQNKMLCSLIQACGRGIRGVGGGAET